MTLPAHIAAELAAALRPYPCTKMPNRYDGSPPNPPCRHCEALAKYDAYIAIVQLPKPPAIDAAGGERK